MKRAVPNTPNMEQALQIVDFIDSSLARQAAMMRLFGTTRGRQPTPHGILEIDFSTPHIIAEVNETISAIQGIRLMLDEPGGNQVLAVFHQWHGPNVSDPNKHLWATSIGQKHGIELFDHPQLRMGILGDIALANSTALAEQTDPLSASQ